MTKMSIFLFFASWSACVAVICTCFAFYPQMAVLLKHKVHDHAKFCGLLGPEYVRIFEGSIPCNVGLSSGDRRYLLFGQRWRDSDRGCHFNLRKQDRVGNISAGCTIRNGDYSIRGWRHRNYIAAISHVNMVSWRLSKISIGKRNMCGRCRKAWRDDSLEHRHIGAQLTFFRVSGDPALPKGGSGGDNSDSYRKNLYERALSLLGLGFLAAGLWTATTGDGRRPIRWGIGLVFGAIGFILQANHPFPLYFWGL